MSNRFTTTTRILFAITLLIALMTLTATLAQTGFSGAQEATGEWGVSGKATHMGAVGVPFRYLAAHHHDGQPTFRQGAVVRIEKGKRHTWARAMDVCAGSGCRAADLSRANFSRLASPGTGVIRVRFECGRRGQLPMRRCLAGEG